MITISPRAAEKIRQVMTSKKQEGSSLRLSIQGRGLGGFRHELRFVPADSASDGDVQLTVEGLHVLIDPSSAENLEGASIDFVEDGLHGGFKVENPNPLWRDPVAAAVQQVLDERINPGVASHGGFVTLLEVKDGVAYVALGGGCQGCGLADVTLRQGVDALIRQMVPAIQEVVDTTDHASGTNPYYRPAKGGQSPFQGQPPA
jgi:Fe/S biogenesis protein NfuA